MNRRDFLKVACMTAAATSCGWAKEQKDRKPNIIMILADDMGYGDAGCYGGTNLVPTPNIDRLAKEGVRFTDGYVTAPVCGPCRYGLLSGAYQQRFGVQWNPDAWSKVPGLEETSEKNRIPSSQKLVDQALSGAGYKTGMVGKWNLPNYPKTTFDESMSVIHFGADYWPEEDGSYIGVNEKVARSSTKRISWEPKNEGDEYLTDRLGRQAVEFIDRHSDEAFFLYLAFNAPHSPMQAQKKYADKVAHLKTEATKLYGAMLLSMDDNIGRVLDALDKKGLADNTLVAFVSDNGPSFAYNVDWPKEWPRELLGSAGPLNGHKGQFFEGGIRVPFIMRWPDKLKSGQVYSEAVSALDLYPTFCAAAKAEIPSGTHLDGVDIVPYLLKDKSGSPHELLFWYSGDSGAVRGGKWKLYVYKNTHRLYDLVADIGEKNDLARKYPEVKDKLLNEYRKFCKQMPSPLSSYSKK